MVIHNKKFKSSRIYRNGLPQDILSNGHKTTAGEGECLLIFISSSFTSRKNIFLNISLMSYSYLYRIRDPKFIRLQESMSASGWAVRCRGYRYIYGRGILLVPSSDLGRDPFIRSAVSINSVPLNLGH